MAKDKIVEFPEEGVIVKLKEAHENIYVDKKPLIITQAMKQPQIKPEKFTFIEEVINIAFCEKKLPKKYLKKINPPVKLRIRYNKRVKQVAARRPKKLAWWDGSKWVLLKSENRRSPSKNWEGYGDTETSGWDDPPIAWGT